NQGSASLSNVHCHRPPSLRRTSSVGLWAADHWPLIRLPIAPSTVLYPARPPCHPEPHRYSIHRGNRVWLGEHNDGDNSNGVHKTCCRQKSRCHNFSCTPTASYPLQGQSVGRSP